MGTIKILPKDVISKIAAGEVIERPASVVKELIENSIDAGANRISITIEKAGKKLIKVVDNGMGMSKDDLECCVKRYATSKISSIDDLLCLYTLGFRGEALASIGAVSKLKISSKPHDQLLGYRIEVEAGEMTLLEESGLPSGTIIEVRDLFFNTPARKKFLRSDKVETRHIVDVITKISLAYLNINFSFNHGNKTIFNLTPCDQFIFRFSTLFGDLDIFMEEYIKVYNDMLIKLNLAHPDMDRPKPDRLFLYINNRIVKDRLIMSAIMEAYNQRLVKGRYPQGAVFIEIDPKLVDFNVHPAKTEVRFRNENKIYKRLFLCIKDLLNSKYGISSYITKGTNFDILENFEEYNTLIPEFPHIIGQLKNTYIICEDKEGILIIDQHAAHERILYERLKQDFLNGNIYSQKLIQPYHIELSFLEAEQLNKKLEAIMNLGLEIRPFGGNTFVIISCPQILKNIDWYPFIVEILQNDINTQDIFDHIIKTMACHAAIKSGDILSREEMEGLIKELYKTEVPTNCPHGRPILKRIPYRDLEKIFKREV